MFLSVNVLGSVDVGYTVGRDLKDSGCLSVKYKPPKNKPKYTFKVYEKKKAKYKLIYHEKMNGDLDLSFNLLNKELITYGKEYKITIERNKKVTETIERDYTEEELQEFRDAMRFLQPFNSSNIFWVVSVPEPREVNLKKTEYITHIEKEVIEEKEFRCLDLGSLALAGAESMSEYLYSQPKRFSVGYADCSSFVWYAWHMVGVDIGSTVGNTVSELSWCEKNAMEVSIEEAKAGDLVFYADPSIKSTYTSHYKHVTHVAMIKDSNTIVEMSSPKNNYREKEIGMYEKNYCIGVYRIEL